MRWHACMLHACPHVLSHPPLPCAHSEDDVDAIYQEISMLAGCQCPNITRYYGSVLEPGSTELMIVMELLACSVCDLLDFQSLDEPSIAYITRGVLTALDYLHAENRIHRDVKAANILLSAAGDVKISDFGVAGQLSGTMGYRRRTFVGTPYWMAPEVIASSEEGYTEKADVWSLGITAIEMATQNPPHYTLAPMKALFIIPKGEPPVLSGHGYSPDFKVRPSRAAPRTACLQCTAC
jgi:serine/threonine-protein kinase 24/25/MST4